MRSITLPDVGVTYGIVPIRVLTDDGTSLRAIRVLTDDGTSLRAIPTMVLSTIFLLAVVIFVPWAVPLFMPRVI